MAPLFANLSALPGTQLAQAMPNAILQAAAQLLGLRFSADGNVDAASVQKAISQSGLFLEANLAKGGGTETAQAALAQSGLMPTASGAQTPTSSPDMKAALLMLRNLLQSWVGDGDDALSQAALAGTAAAKKPAAPKRGALPEGQKPATPTIDTAASGAKAADTGRMLHQQSEAALSRLRLAQFASLSDDADTSVQRPAGGPSYTFELPLALGRETAIAQFQIERDGKDTDVDPAERVWRVRFAVDMEPLGPVHSLITMRGEAVDVTLWAERTETAALFSEKISDLRDGLARAEFNIDDVRCWSGKPATPKQRSGALVDRST